MTHPDPHPEPETLAGLALDDDTATAADRRHVASCPDCSDAVTQLQRALDLARSSGPLEAPHPDVWRRIEAALDEGGTVPAPRAAAAWPSAGGPRASRRSGGLRDARRGRSRRLAWTAVAAVLGVLVGMGAAIAFWREPGAGVTTIATVPLDTLDTKQSRGTAELQRSGDRLDLRLDTTSLDAGSGYLEVWLLNADGRRMVSVGVLRTPGSETFPVSQALLDKGYVVVDVSREGYDDQPQHSGDSLARGRLPD